MSQHFTSNHDDYCGTGVQSVAPEKKSTVHAIAPSPWYLKKPSAPPYAKRIADQVSTKVNTSGRGLHDQTCIGALESLIDMSL